MTTTIDKKVVDINTATISGTVVSLKEMADGKAFMNLSSFDGMFYIYIPCLLTKMMALFAAEEVAVGAHVVVTGWFDNWRTAGEKWKKLVFRPYKIIISGGGFSDPDYRDIDEPEDAKI